MIDTYTLRRFARSTADKVLGAEAAKAADHIDAQTAEIARMRNALEWYSSMSKEMGNAAIHQDSQAMLTLMKEIAVDYGKRARAALAQEGS